MSIESLMTSNHLILCQPFSSQYQCLFQWVSSSHQVTKYWSLSFSISLSNEYSGLISFMIDWFDFLSVPRTLKSLLQHHSSKVSVLRCSAFFIVQLSHPYMTPGKTIALTRWAFVGKIMSQLFNTLRSSLVAQSVKNLPALVMTFLARSNVF